MANENPSRENASRQQSSERSQTGSTTSQQGSGSASQQGGSQGSYGQGGTAQGASGRQGTSTWQGGRSGQSGGALQRRGSPLTSPYSSNYESGYGSGPFSVMRRISDEMDRLFENFGMGRSLFSGQEQGNWGEGEPVGQNAPSMWSPHIEVCERNGKLLIQADLPGIKRDDINVRVEQDAIILQGQRNQEQTTNQSGYYRSERSYGSFYRTIPLPEGANTESATASFRDGVLEIELDAPRQQLRGRMLEIRDSASRGG